MSRIMIALGGNALGNTPQEQIQIVKKTSKPIVDLIEQGHDVIITHGNGPQVGMIHLAMEVAAAAESKVPEMPLAECGAMSQGYIGYHLQNAIREELLDRGIHKPVTTLITQMIVDQEDQAFTNPTKPIGGFYNAAEAKNISEEKGYQFIEDSGRGWRRVIPSPRPVNVVEKEAVKQLVDTGNVVITCGGGGIPVVREGNRLVGVSAVIDKDSASETMAEELNVDYLFMLTAVDKVAINFGKSNQEQLDSVSVDEALQYMKENHFAPGSMLPKVQAAIQFVQSRKGRKAIITSLERAKEAITGSAGTTFYA